MAGAPDPFKPLNHPMSPGSAGYCFQPLCGWTRPARLRRPPGPRKHIFQLLPAKCQHRRPRRRSFFFDLDPARFLPFSRGRWEVTLGLPSFSQTHKPNSPCFPEFCEPVVPGRARAFPLRAKNGCVLESSPPQFFLLVASLDPLIFFSWQPTPALCRLCPPSGRLAESTPPPAS